MIRNVIVKVTLGCNISCKYCYVRHNRDFVTDNRIMDSETLEALIRNVGDYLHSQPLMDEFVFYWHGGEPLMAGMSFFDRCYELQTRYLPRGISIINTIQTNGILLNDNWAHLIKDIGFGLCLSLDGPPDINDSWRRTSNGKGTHHLVRRGMEALQRSGVPLSVLSVITPEALPHGPRVYRSLRDLGCTWMDFMYPFYSRIDNTLGQSIKPERWGYFLSDVFDAWISEGNPDVDVRLLRDICMLLLGGKTMMCVSSVDCSYVITVNPNGEVFICDDLLAYADSALGNIHRDRVSQIAEHPKLTRLADPNILFGKECQTCKLFPYCKGGCTLFRARQIDDFLGRHYYCAAQEIIIKHIHNYFSNLKKVPQQAEGRRAATSYV